MVPVPLESELFVDAIKAASKISGGSVSLINVGVTTSSPFESISSMSLNRAAIQVHKQLGTIVTNKLESKVVCEFVDGFLTKMVAMAIYLSGVK